MTYQRNATPEPLAGRLPAPDAATYLLAAEYWHPDVKQPWLEYGLTSAASATDDSHEIEVLFAGIDDEQDVRCWWYLLMAAEVAS